MDMMRDASVARLKSRFYKFGSFESFAGHIPIIPFHGTWAARISRSRCASLPRWEVCWVEGQEMEIQIGKSSLNYLGGNFSVFTASKYRR